MEEAHDNGNSSELCDTGSGLSGGGRGVVLDRANATKLGLLRIILSPTHN